MAKNKPTSSKYISMKKPSWFKRFFINRNVFNLFSGQTISQSGDSIFEIALLWMLLELTGSNAATGLIAMSGYLPSLLFGLFSGALVDRFDKRRIMLLADVARAILVLCIPILYYVGGLNGLVLGVFTFAIASFNTLFNPARDALVGKIVPPEKQLQANSLIHTSWQYALFVGPAIAGFLLVFVNEVQLFIVDAFTFLLSFYFIYQLTTGGGRKTVDRKIEHGDTETQSSLRETEQRKSRRKEIGVVIKESLRDMREGLEYVKGDKRLLALVFMTVSNNLFLMGPAVIGAPIFVREVLQEGVESYAFVQIAYGIGMVLGTVALNYYSKYFRQSQILLWGIALDGITFLPLLWVTSFEGMFLTLVIHCMAIPMIIVTRPTIILQLVPSEMQGRVFSMIGVSVQGITAVSIAVTGIVATFIPINIVYGLIAVAAAATALIGASVKELREL
ncbi:MAG: MFS transporter [Chitinophagales bacterium]